MEQFSATSRSYGVDVTAVKDSNTNGNHMFVGKSRPPPLDLARVPAKDVITAAAAGTAKKKKNKKATTSLFLSAALWTDPEMKRKRRVAKYKMYSAEGKIKASIKKGIRWIKRKCSRIVHGF
ncbi:hypothetical protein MLD38_020715 [Melastoma candidum]|uniref:Uncharacterized protein n=1 Tax=Melastoma candidum TaxID=119954 RepID=A0ACB9QH12_9MYRT|nr:hypothetical protein MLD38_020715 [Melastoma candidum]